MAERVELFLVDPAFIDRKKNTHGILSANAGKVCSLTAQGLSYFVTPDYVSDLRNPASRPVGWTATTHPSILVDSTVFSDFCKMLSQISTDEQNAFFALMDTLGLANALTTTHAELEAKLVANAAISSIYVAGSASLSSKHVSGTIYHDDGSSQPVSVPTFMQFNVNLTAGSTPVTYTCIAYLSNDDWITDYTQSTIEIVVPPLPYDTLLNAPIASATANVFATATTTATLSYTTAQKSISQMDMSGLMEYSVELQDGANRISVPFNIYYKGRIPSITEIRQAIRAAITASGVGTEDQWKSRCPNLYITSRFFFVPLWDKTYTWPSVGDVYQDIVQIEDLQSLIQKSFVIAGQDLNISDMALIACSYNKMMILAVPDISAPITDDVKPTRRILDLFPDYQALSSVDQNFALMSTGTQALVTQLNRVMAQASGVTLPTPYTLSDDGTLSYYAITVGATEICVVTKECYNSLKDRTT